MKDYRRGNHHLAARRICITTKRVLGQRMWARGYFACSTGNVTDEMKKEYIHNHSDKDDDFHVE